MSKSPLTVKGAARLREKLKTMKQVERRNITQALAEARAHGDLSENAEYDAARQAQGMLEARISQLESALNEAQLIDVAALDSGGRVVFGATVELLRLDDDTRVTYQIVGEVESDIEQGLLSVTSPIARALIGREQGDVVEVTTPGGAVEYEVVEIRYE